MSLFWISFPFLYSFLHHILLLLMISCSKKKCVLFTGHSLWKCSCTFSQAIMWVSYIQLCVVNMTVCFCAVAWHADWDQMPPGQYAIPTVVYYLQCVCSKWFSLPFLTCLSLSSPFKKTAVPCGQAFWSFKNGSKSGARLEVALIYFHLATIIALC